MVLEFKLRRFCHIPNALITSSKTQVEDMQGEGSGVTGGGRGAECPQRLVSGKFLLTFQEKRGKEKKKKG